MHPDPSADPIVDTIDLAYGGHFCGTANGPDGPVAVVMALSFVSDGEDGCMVLRDAGTDRCAAVRLPGAVRPLAEAFAKLFGPGAASALLIASQAAHCLPA